MSNSNPTNLVEGVRRLRDAGLSIIPIKTDGSKAPALPTWKPFERRQATEAELRKWFGNDQRLGIAIIGGAVSGNLEMLDHDAPELIAEWRELVEEAAPGLLDRLPQVETPAGGLHIFYRCETIANNQKLAAREIEVAPNVKGAIKRDGKCFKVETLIETRGEGGYVITAGSPAACHPSGKAYKLIHGDLKAIPTITAQERDILLSCARSFNQYIKPAQHVAPERQAKAKGLQPGTDFNQRGDVRALLNQHGWRHLRNDGLGELWARPGVEHISARLFADGALWPFSTNASPFEHERVYSAFAVFAYLEHGGDFSAAAKALGAQGYGETRPHTDAPTNTPTDEATASADVRSDKPQMLSVTIVEGLLTLELTRAERGKARLTARKAEELLHRDVLSLDKAEDRAKFIKQLRLENEAEADEAHRTLLTLAEQFETLPVPDEEDAAPLEERKVIFAALPDGRLIEQLAGSRFAVFDPDNGQWSYCSKVEAAGIVYRPLDDDYVLKGGLHLPERVTEYGDDAALDAAIVACILRYSDVSPREMQFAAKYVRLSYLADKLHEVPYLRATGERGSGKSRFICTVGMLCLRPVLVTSPSAASLFRTMDAYQPTLIIDECNFTQDSEDSTALMQVLNSGFQRLTSVSRMERGADAQMTLRMFSAFGPKLIGSLKLSDSPAFESRCVAVKLKKTERKDIPFRITARMLADFAALREQLYLWRLRNWSRDFEQAFDQAEAELKEYSIEPRFVQIAIPLYGLLDDAALKASFAQSLEARTSDAGDERKATLDGQLAGIIHELLFAPVEGDDQAVTWRRTDSFLEPEEGKPLEDATIERITAQLNEGLPERQKHDAKWVGNQVRKLGFKRQEITSRKSQNYKKSAVVLDRQAFREVFKSFNLPLPGNFLPGTSGQCDNLNTDNGLDCPEVNKNERLEKITSGQSNTLPNKELRSCPEVPGSNFRKVSQTPSEGLPGSPDSSRKVGRL